MGVLELNRNPENYYADVEQAAFNPMNIVEGIGFSPDKMLQGRLFSYGDAQRYRLGVNHTEIPVNRPPLPDPRLPPRRADAHRRQLRIGKVTNPTATANGRTPPPSKSRPWP